MDTPQPNWAVVAKALRDHGDRWGKTCVSISPGVVALFDRDIARFALHRRLAMHHMVEATIRGCGWTVLASTHDDVVD
ncbi:MAG: hypothetical protein JNK04_08310, partial [Myxococcales bacterium]|nr:hypothetical protein [Myxococcales bacterium]